MPAANSREINNHEQDQEETVVLDRKKRNYTKEFVNETSERSSKSASAHASLLLTPSPSVAIPSFSLSDYNVPCGSESTTIASEYPGFDDSGRSCCMHVFNIHQSSADYKKIGMRPCTYDDSKDFRRLWFIDSEGHLQLSSQPATCMKYKEQTESKRFGLSICDPSKADSMTNAVRVKYDLSSMRLSGMVEGVFNSDFSFVVVNKLNGNENMKDFD